MENCIYISLGANLPNQNASALRVSSIVEVLNQANISCDVIGQGPVEYGQTYKVSDRYVINSTYNTKKKNSFLNKVSIFFFPTRPVLRIINYILKTKKIKYIFIYQVIPSALMRRIIKIAKRNNIKLVFDIVEYQTLSQQKGLIGVLFNYLPSKRIINNYSKHGIIISISTYLERMFIRKGRQVIAIPFFFNVKDINNTEHYYLKDGRVRIIYAGAPFGSRDTIINAVKGVLLLNKGERERFLFTFAGVNREDMKTLGLTEKELELTSEQFSYLGKIPHDDVINLYKQSDYSLLLKPKNKRFSKAGFPTKVSESWALSTPVIANLTGDMDLYMVDMENGVVAVSDSPQDFSNALKRTLSITEAEYSYMRNKSRETAQEKLDIDIFGSKIIEFIRN